MAKKRTIPPASPQDLLQSEEWQSIQSIDEYRGIFRGEQPVGELLSRIIRKHERALPEPYRLPNEIAQALSRFLRGKGFKPPAPRRFDHDAVARFVHQELQRGNRNSPEPDTLWAFTKAADKYDCQASSAEKWYYEWRKKQVK